MFNDDQFRFDLRLGDWLFTVALGIALGLVLAGAWRAYRGPKTERRWALLVAALGGVMGAVTGVLALDAGPVSVIFFRLRPYLSAASEAAALVGALILGAGVAFGAVLLARRLWRRESALLAGAGFAVVALGIVLWGVDAYETRDGGFHPDGTETALVASTEVISGLNIPTGIAVAGNGDIAVVELQAAGFGLYSPEGDGFTERIRTRLPVAEDLQGFHIAFHPGYPDQPYVYVTSEQHGGGGERRLQLWRGHIDGAAVEWEALLTDLPTGQIEGAGDHYGSAVTFCEGAFFLTVGDTEALADFTSPLDAPDVLRDEAMDLTSARGKIFRWELSGIDLTPRPQAGTLPPIYAYGFRNPFGAACDEATGYPVVAENGPNGHDQVRLVPPGSNNEWPLSVERDALRKPLLDTGNVHIAPTGVAVRETDDGREVLLSAFVTGGVYALPLSADGEPGTLRLLAEADGGAFGVAADARGCAYFTSFQAVFRLEDGRCGR